MAGDEADRVGRGVLANPVARVEPGGGVLHSLDRGWDRITIADRRDSHEVRCAGEHRKRGGEFGPRLVAALQVDGNARRGEGHGGGDDDVGLAEPVVAQEAGGRDSIV